MNKKVKINSRINFLACITAICIMAAFMGSCNRNSDQLPIINPDTLTVKIPYVINAHNINFIFKQVKRGTHDTEWVALQNNSDTDITGITIFVQMCNALPQNYTNCALQKNIPIGLLQKDSTTTLHFLYSDQQLTLDKNYINAGILSCGNFEHPLEGVYYSNFTAFKKSANDTISYGRSKGYILADGTSVFMFSGLDTSYSFTFTGTFDSNVAFNGEMFFYGKNVSLVGIDTAIPTNAMPNIAVRWKITTPTNDTISMISDVLTKTQ